MIKTCPVCSKQFETVYTHKKYCSAECVRRIRNKHNSGYNKATRNEKRIEWAYNEAEWLNHLAYEEGVDALADYVWGNYQKYKGGK